MQQLAGRAKVPPELVGQWELAPENKVLPVKTLNIEANATYQLKAANEGVVSRGMMTVQPGRNLNSGRPEPLQGQMLLYDEISGQVGTLYHDFTKSQAMEIVDPDGIKYRVHRAATAK